MDNYKYNKYKVKYINYKNQYGGAINALRALKTGTDKIVIGVIQIITDIKNGTDTRLFSSIKINYISEVIQARNLLTEYEKLLSNIDSQKDPTKENHISTTWSKLQNLLSDIEDAKRELVNIEYRRIIENGISVFRSQTDHTEYDKHSTKLLSSITELKNIVSTEHEHQLIERMELLSIEELTSLKNLCNNKTIS